jgi:hypothetical protein
MEGVEINVLANKQLNFDYTQIEKRNTNTEKIPRMITGFLPIRSSTIPHIVEVKARPSMYEAPT